MKELYTSAHGKVDVDVFSYPPINGAPYQYRVVVEHDDDYLIFREYAKTPAEVRQKCIESMQLLVKDLEDAIDAVKKCQLAETEG